VKKYVIEFLYCDNNQLYQEDVELTLDQRARLLIFLCGLETNGVIESTEEASEFIYEYTEPNFIKFDRLKALWSQGSLIDSADMYGVIL
jgi:hypothetical protein